MRAVVLAIPLLLIACAKEQIPTPAPKPAPTPVAVKPVPVSPPATLGDKWVDAPRSEGDWIYRRDSRGSVALFGVLGTDARFIIRCDSAARRIFLSRAGALPGTDSGLMTIRSTSGSKSFTAKNNGDTPSYVAAALPVDERKLDDMVYSRGRFLVSVNGYDDLIIPSWPEIARVIEDCRT
jgi:hypothetical protein